ncbi:MAG: TIGR03790 family protein [Akkermansiaceae bacterium]
MKQLLLALTASLFATASSTAEIPPETVAILYNTESAESKELATYYAKARSIPTANLIGLSLPTTDDVSREDYNDQLRDPLRKIFGQRGWWQMGTNAQGKKLPTSSKVTTLVCMRGVPFKIKRSAKIPPATNMPKQFAPANEASVDSELTMFGVEGLSEAGPLNNPYFKKDTSITKANLPYMLLVGRIDGPSAAICKRLIDDAIATEKRGLWGMCYLDHAKKGGGFAIGDQWLETIENINNLTGIPTVVDRNKQTFLTNYPMNDAAIYYGWYIKEKNGPLLNPAFRFRKGAVAVHLHSFSAQFLRDANKHWTGPILAAGAAATVGNVYEPYLQLTHYFDILHSRLIKGYTLVEAAQMSIPYLSWQTIAIGDPLYRPFLHLDGTGEKHADDRDFRAIRIANQRWGEEPETMVKKLRTVAASKSNALFYEYLGLWYRARNQDKIAAAFFQTLQTANSQHT